MNPNDIQPNEIPLPGERPKKATALDAADIRGELTIGAFFAEHRQAIDARKEHLARVGMLPEHAKALAMPDLDPRVAPPAVQVHDEHAPGPAYEPRKLPKLPGVNVQAHEEE